MVGFLFTFPSILSAQYIDTKWPVKGYFRELWFAEEEDTLGKHQEFYKGWADGSKKAFYVYEGAIITLEYEK